MIKKIDDYDSRDVRHVDAQNLLQNSESVKLVVERSEPSIDHSIAHRHMRNLTNVESIETNKQAATVYPLDFLLFQSQ